MLVCLVAAGCDPDTTGDEKIDPTKTQLYVYNFYGGYGSDWLSAAKKRFEEKHKDDENWEEGKKGVQVIINNQKTSMGDVSSQILSNRDEVYFSEFSYYYTLKGMGVLGDITDVVTEKLTSYGEDRSIEEKLSDEQRDYYGVKEGSETKYYALPHYAGYSGLIYNVELFDEEGYYFAKTPEGTSRDGKFVNEFNTEKSAGPDGVFDTFDDGLPATYEEFFILCDYIKDGGTTPVIWNGDDHIHYLNNLAQALQADYEGVDQSMLNYKLNGSATTLATVSNGSVSINASTTFSESGAHILASQAGKYYGLSFLEKLIKNDKYHNALAFNTAYSHMNAQEDFIYAGHDGQTKPAAMLCDGVWWEMEAAESFKNMVDEKGDGFSKYNRKFAFMPLPRATQAKVDEAAAAEENARYTLYDGIYSLCFMKANVEEWKKPLALDFIQFCNTDESLVEFTTVTNTVKALNYTLNEDEKRQLTNFGRSLVELKEASQIVYPFSTNTLYANNQSFFMTHSQFYSNVSGKEYQWPSLAMHEDNVTAEQYFNGMTKYYKDHWIVK